MKEDNTYYDERDGFNLPGSLRINPFDVPKDYFEKLPSSILLQARLQQLCAVEKTSFSVPESYFSQLTDNIKSQVKLEQHTQDAPKTWNTPQGYFEGLSQNIQAQIRIDKASNTEELEVPTGYFDSLSERIQTRVFTDKLKQQVSTDGFETPSGYAAQLTGKILSQTADEKREKTKVVKLNFRKWVQYVAAACVATVLGIVSYNTIVERTSQANSAESHLASIPEEEIINYLSALNDSHDILDIMDCINHSHDSDGVCTHVKENDIEDYLNYML